MQKQNSSMQLGANMAPGSFGSSSAPKHIWEKIALDEKSFYPRNNRISIYKCATSCGARYFFHASKDSESESGFFMRASELCGGKLGLVMHRRVPKLFLEQLRLMHSELWDDAPVREISYVFGAGGACSSEYYMPKQKFEQVRGLGYYFELISASDMARNGAKAFSTSEAPSFSRRNQLLKVGLVPWRVFSADEWLAGLGKGVKRVLDKYAQGGEEFEKFAKEYF